MPEAPVLRMSHGECMTVRIELASFTNLEVTITSQSRLVRYNKLKFEYLRTAIRGLCIQCESSTY